MKILSLRDNKVGYLYGVLCEEGISDVAVKIALCDSLQIPVTFVPIAGGLDTDRFSLESILIASDYNIHIEIYQEESVEDIEDYQKEIILRYLSAFKQFYRFETLSDNNKELVLHEEDVKKTEKEIKNFIENRDKRKKEAKLEELKRLYSKLEDEDKNKLLAKIIMNGGL